MIKYTNAILWIVSILMVFAILVMDAKADDIQWSKGFTINCTDATEREDQTPLSVDEIYSIKYYAYSAGDLSSPEHVYEVIGACKPYMIDTKQLTTGMKEFYATTVDTDGRESSDVSSTKVTHNIMKAKPNPPSGLR